MSQKVVLIAGATGFLGSHICESLINDNYKVLALIRNDSKMWRIGEINNKQNLHLINTDKTTFVEELHYHSPKYFINAAWIGVSSRERNSWSTQLKNLYLVSEYLQLSKDLGIAHFIAMGSQAEYGTFNGRVNETFECKPTTAYGSVKLIAYKLIEQYCNLNNIIWHWLRLFSVYGTREDNNWLIPSVIHQILNNSSIDLTACTQRYDYIYAKDLGKAIIKLLESKHKSDVFNISSNSSTKLRDMLLIIGNLLKAKEKLNFGALPFRENQVMHMEGDSTKFNTAMNLVIHSDFELHLKEVVDYYKKKHNLSVK